MNTEERAAGSQRRRIMRLAGVIALVWTLVNAASLAWNMAIEDDWVGEVARIEAVGSLNKDRALRLWLSSLGGLYAPVGDKVRPNPYMGHLSERDLFLDHGRVLTLIDPATAIREVGETFAELYGTRVRIVARIQLNPANAPDAWELKALDAFEQGAREVSEIVTAEDGKATLRMMQPMHMTPYCVRCHASTGVNVGELYGATGAIIPLERYWALAREEMATLMATHGGIWLLGIGLIGFATRLSLRADAERFRREDVLRKFSRAVEQSASGIVITDAAGRIEFANPRYCQISGYAPAELIGRTPKLLQSGETDPAVYAGMWEALTAGREWRGELLNRRKDGEQFWCMESLSSLRDAQGKVTHFVGVIEDISERKYTEETIRRLAYSDPLTDLPNRLQFRERLEQATIWCKRTGGLVALCYIDLDRFKAVNDTLGHQAGDLLLKCAAERILANVREGDVVARLGGDEFAIVAGNIHRGEDAAVIAEKVAHALRQPMTLDGHELHVSASIGISLFPTDATDLDDLVKKADIALYAAKEQGRNNFRFYAQDINVLTLERLKLENDLRKAVERDELRLEYQPRVAIGGGEVVGVEALVRWQHPTLGRIPPGRFIPVAEETGSILGIGEWVLVESCRQAGRWDREGLPPLIVSVNLSARQFGRPGLLEFIRVALETEGLPPERLELEITESALMRDPAVAVRLLSELKTFGVKVSIDDFGTGYSSLAQLRQLPVDVLKIDRSFVQQMTVDTEDRAIVETVLSLARAIDVDVVAEGVETAAQDALLRAMGCDFVQGYYYARPLPAAVVSAMLHASPRIVPSPEDSPES
ncbi:MAG: EAL domain-containing protein [Sulfurisoma sp.]|nr:EAL domain-containing protein [Sulfurisoma sp.]